ncbi:uncharacterized protein F4822DRAFT_424504 [Hypoxylon trugodes]|uniref:uncharacterized protein n=1 Tax=Hypoxylon trugodes TaxID=326681 RepID=UPI00219E1120|nr:uncharacterized protein F4822DRAFT_424504 [Hypoxylon trugodes]KAI1394038.1 hypothetical protein F4822DRAFT_424504 [Hypoxylon trugodes]
MSSPKDVKSDRADSPCDLQEPSTPPTDIIAPRSTSAPVHYTERSTYVTPSRVNNWALAISQDQRGIILSPSFASSGDSSPLDHSPIDCVGYRREAGDHISMMAAVNQSINRLAVADWSGTTTPLLGQSPIATPVSEADTVQHHYLPSPTVHAIPFSSSEERSLSSYEPNRSGQHRHYGSFPEFEYTHHQRHHHSVLDHYSDVQMYFLVAILLMTVLVLMYIIVELVKQR